VSAGVPVSPDRGTRIELRLTLAAAGARPACDVVAELDDPSLSTRRLPIEVSAAAAAISDVNRVHVQEDRVPHRLDGHCSPGRPLASARARSTIATARGSSGASFDRRRSSA
jgi:hypothetical protein